jgi:hypothetical protein
MTNTGGPLAAESVAGRSARARALRAYAEAKRRVIGRTPIMSDPVTQSTAVPLRRTGRSLKRPGQ